MLGYLCLDGNELAHPGRLMAYLRHVGNPCAVGPQMDLYGWVDDPGEVFTTPAGDNAPWWDPNDIRSNDVLGVWLTTVALSSPYSRETTALRHGGSHGPVAYGSRELLLEGLVVTRSIAGAEYGRQWVQEALTGSPCVGDCDFSTLTLMRHCPVPGDDGLRFLHNVALNSIEWVDQSPGLPQHCGLEFSATLTSGSPWVTKAPQKVFEALLLAPDAECDICRQMLSVVYRPEEVPGLACGCVSATPRRIPTRKRPNCYLPPLSVARQVAVVANPKQWLAGTLRVSVFGGSGDFSGAGARNIRVRGYANPDAYAADNVDDILASGAPCVDIEIGCVPTGATLTIDGATRRATVGIGENNRDGLAYLSSRSGRFMWPDFGCNGLVIVIEADATLTSPDSAIVIETIETEKG